MTPRPPQCTAPTCAYPSRVVILSPHPSYFDFIFLSIPVTLPLSSLLIITFFLFLFLIFFFVVWGISVYSVHFVSFFIPQTSSFSTKLET